MRGATLRDERPESNDRPLIRGCERCIDGIDRERLGDCMLRDGPREPPPLKLRLGDELRPEDRPDENDRPGEDDRPLDPRDMDRDGELRPPIDDRPPPPRRPRSCASSGQVKRTIATAAIPTLTTLLSVYFLRRIMGAVRLLSAICDFCCFE